MSEPEFLRFSDIFGFKRNVQIPNPEANLVLMSAVCFAFTQDALTSLEANEPEFHQYARNILKSAADFFIAFAEFQSLDAMDSLVAREEVRAKTWNIKYYDADNNQVNYLKEGITRSLLSICTGETFTYCLNAISDISLAFYEDSESEIASRYVHEKLLALMPLILEIKIKYQHPIGDVEKILHFVSEEVAELILFNLDLFRK